MANHPLDCFHSQIGIKLLDSFRFTVSNADTGAEMNKVTITIKELEDELSKVELALKEVEKSLSCTENITAKKELRKKYNDLQILHLDIDSVHKGMTIGQDIKKIEADEYSKKQLLRLSFGDE